MLPLLREQDTRSSTVEERVIGAGLKALDKNKDGKVDKQEIINGFLDGRNSAKERAEEEIDSKET